ncbi:unnamed protein product, partial [marine sediment metagenome]
MTMNIDHIFSLPVYQSAGLPVKTVYQSAGLPVGWSASLPVNYQILDKSLNY